MIPAVRKYKIRRLKRMVERLGEIRLDKEFNEEEHPRTMEEGHEGEFAKKEQILTPKQKQRDREYMKLASSMDSYGIFPSSRDCDRAIALVKEAAIEAGAYQKKDGDPMTFYHGTPLEELNEFDIEKGMRFGYGVGHYFTIDYGAARRYSEREDRTPGKIVEAYFMTQRVVTDDTHEITQDQIEDFKSKFDGATWRRISDIMGDSDIICDLSRAARKAGYPNKKITDAIVDSFGVDAYLSRGDGWSTGDVSIVANESIIKSSEIVERDEDGDIIPLSERFPPKNRDIRGHGNISNKNKNREARRHIRNKSNPNK